MVSKAEEIPIEVLCQQQLDFSAESWVSSVTGTRDSVELDTISPARRPIRLRENVKGRIDVFRDRFSRAKSWHGERERRMERKKYFIDRKPIEVRNRDIEVSLDGHRTGSKTTLHHHNKGHQLQDKLSSSDPNLMCSSFNSHDSTSKSRDTPDEQGNALARRISKAQNDQVERKRFQDAVQLKALKFGSPVLPSRSGSLSNPSSDSPNSHNKEVSPTTLLVGGSLLENTRESSHEVQGVGVTDGNWLGYEQVTPNTRPVDRSSMMGVMREASQAEGVTVAVGEISRNRSGSSMKSSERVPKQGRRIRASIHDSVISDDGSGGEKASMFDRDVPKQGSKVHSCRGDGIATTAAPASPSFQRKTSKDNIPKPAMRQESECNHYRNADSMPPFQRKTSKDNVPKPAMRQESECIHDRIIGQRMDSFHGGSSELGKPKASVGKNPPPKCQPQDLGRGKAPNPQRNLHRNNTSPSTFCEFSPQAPQRRASVSATSVVSDITFACSADDSPPICLSRWGDYIDELTEDIDFYERGHQSWSHPTSLG